MVVDGRVVEVHVRRSARARRVRLTVAPGRPPEVVLPARAPAAAADRLLAERGDWLAAVLRRQAAERARTPALGLDRPGVIWLDGTPLPVRWREGAPAAARLGAGGVTLGGRPEHAPAALERLLRREARRRLEAEAALEAARLGVSFARLAIRDPRSRWGSCSGAGTLSFSWRLAMAPPEVRASVVVHELCHLRELNHSAAFWRLLDDARPGWRAEQAWLRAHGGELMAYRPALSVAD